jgi:hypothetical protein
MNTNKKTFEMDTKVLLSTLWIVVFGNMVYADVLSLFIPGVHDELAEFAGGTPIALLMLAGAVIIEIPIAMIILSRVLRYRANRWVNIIAAAISIVLVIAGGEAYPHYVFLSAIEVVCMLVIIWNAWKWPKEEG